MKAEYINPFLNATVNVIQTMSGTKVVPNKPEIKNGNLSWGHVSGIIGIASDTMTGHMVLSFEAPCIVAIVNKMLGESFTEMNNDIVDAVGEITNMICGGAKKDLAESGLMFDLAIPLMVQGKNVQITQFSKGPVISIPFTTEAGKFVVEVNLINR